MYMRALYAKYTFKFGIDVPTSSKTLCISMLLLLCTGMCGSKQISTHFYYVFGASVHLDTLRIIHVHRIPDNKLITHNTVSYLTDELSRRAY